MPSVLDVIVHCQKQIKKEPPAEKLIHYLNRLDRLRVGVQDLMDTGVGRTVNQLSRHDGDVGRFASKLVKKWKAMVSDENSEDSDSQSSSSSQEDSDEDGGEKEDSDHEKREKVSHHYPVKQENIHANMNGHHSDEPGDEFNHAESDDEDRLCIADEDGGKGNNNKSSTLGSVIKQEAVLHDSSGDETDVCENVDFVLKNEVDYNSMEESPRFSPPQKFKSERLSESDSSSAEEMDKYSCTQTVPQKSHFNNETSHNSPHHGSAKHDERRAQKDLCIKQFDENKGIEDQFLKASASESKSSRHSEKRVKDPHHSAEKKGHKRDRDELSSPVKVKIEPELPRSDDSVDSDERRHSSKRKEKKSKRSKDKSKCSSEVYKKSKDHKSKSDKKEKNCDVHKSKHKHEKEKRDSHRKSGESSSSSSKKKSDESSEKNRTTSQSPDRKKIKLEHSLTKKPSIHIDEEINSASGVNFEELLGCLDKNLNKTKDRQKEKDKSKKHSSSTSVNKSKDHKDEVTKLVRRNDVKKEDKRKKHLESIIAPTALNISPNYRPPLAAMVSRPMLPMPSKHSVGNLNILETCDPGNYWEDSRMTATSSCINNTQDDALSTMMSGRNQRTKVFSGRAVACTGVVPRLFDMCMQVIQENIGDLGYTGGVPFEILKPALERATAQQLLQIEEYNPYLIGSTDELWKFHSNREFRGRGRAELETWRELYERCVFERDEKFATVRNKMLKKSEVAVPVRKAKLAYVEPVGGPRFSRQKAATIKNGMKSLKIKEEKGPKKGVGSSASVGFNNPGDNSKIVHEHAVLISPESRGHSRGGGGGGRGGGGDGESTARSKPRKAPLMARTMKFIRTLQRR